MEITGGVGRRSYYEWIGDFAPKCKIATLIAELITRGRVLAVQLGGIRIGIKVEKPESYDGGKHHDVDTHHIELD